MTVNRENLASTETQQAAPMKVSSSKQPRLGWLNWRLGAVVLVVLSGGIGFTATSMLLKLPKSPNCPQIFWPIASASMRLYCAQLEAESGSVDRLLKAIALVEALPEDHALRTEINRNVEQWAKEILLLADKEFQTGNIEEAIAIARKIPARVYAYDLVEKRVAYWESIWEEAETIVAEVERELRDSNWTPAFRAAVQLLNLDNEYWATTKYNEISKKIYLAKEESNKLDNAYALLKGNGVDNWFKAIEEASAIDSTSYAYQEAQNLIAEGKEKLLDHVEKLLERRDWQALLDVSDRIPDRLNLTKEVNDWRTLANAGSDADLGTVDSLQSAILIAQQITTSSPLYQNAQDQVERWKLEIEDVIHLEKARNLAQSGTINDLNTAIAQAQLVPRSNPRYEEAQGEINTWTRNIQTIEDRPILDRAKEFAQVGSINALQEAIAQASSINANRALHPEAQEKIRQWRTSIEEQQDRPFLDQAIALANGKEYPAAIEAARQIQQGRVLHQEARIKIRRWQREIQAQEDFQRAYTIAESRTPEALMTAINILTQIPNSTDIKSQTKELVDRWSYQLLAFATDKANASLLEEAIKLAQAIPSESSSYGSAQAQIQSWRNLLIPAPLPPVEPPAGAETNNFDSPITETNY